MNFLPSRSSLRRCAGYDGKPVALQECKSDDRNRPVHERMKTRAHFDSRTKKITKQSATSQHHLIGKRDELGSLGPVDPQTGLLEFLSMFSQYDHSRNRP